MVFILDSFFFSKSYISNVKVSSAVNERDDLLVQVCNSAFPRAPWDEGEGLCKVCGRDKDGDNVLLCDKCDSEYHRYCLDPLLLRIPERNWYFPSCVSGPSLPCIRTYGSISNQHNRKRNLGEFSCKYLEERSRLAKLMEMKEIVVSQKMWCSEKMWSMLQQCN